MPTIDERLDRFERRQEAIVQALAGLAEVMQITRAMMAELMAWLQQPPSNELPTLLGDVATALNRLGDRIDGLPAAVVQALTESQKPGS